MARHLPYHIGAFDAARGHLEQGMQLYNPQYHSVQAALYGADLGVVCYAHAAWALCFMGYAEQALLRIREALDLAQQLRHPFSQAYALTFAAEVHHHRGEVALSQAHAEATVTLATEQGFPHWVAQGTMLLGWARAMQGQTAEGIATLQQGMAGWRDTGAEVAWPHWLALLAEAYGRAGQTEEGLRAVTQALAMIERHGETRWEAALYRLQGDLLLQSEASPQSLPPASAEECFLQAVEIARRQQARSWELRAALSLARLWQRQGKPAEAHALLAEVYGWFTEGFDTANLHEARILLAELS